MSRFDPLSTTLAVLLLLLLPACGERDPQARDAVLFLDNTAVPLAEFEHYLAVNLLPDEPEDPADETGLDEVKSRLFDTFVDEQLLLAEAKRREISISGLEIEAYLGLGGVGEDAVITDSAWREAERRLMIQRLQEQAAAALPPVDDAAIEEYLAQTGEAQATPRRLRLRSLLFRNLEQAQRVYREISRRRMTFDEAVVAHATNPGQGVLLEMAWDNLDEAHKAALADLRPGQVSRPVEQNGDSYIFELESWLDDSAEAGARATEEARWELERRRLQRAIDGLLEQLHERVEIDPHLEMLPFRYVPA